MARQPYRIARQEHLGDMLDRLRDLGLLEWRWDYEYPRGQPGSGRAVYWITLRSEHEEKYDTKRAEVLVQELCDQQDIIWRPVPPPGGEVQREEVERWIAEQEQARAP
jgi:hypothetical protein